MGRAVSISAGINWLTVTVIVAFHIGALAAFFQPPHIQPRPKRATPLETSGIQWYLLSQTRKRLRMRSGT